LELAFETLIYDAHVGYTMYELHDNVAIDLVKYVRSNTIRNEQQFLLATLAYTSGVFDDTHDYVSSVLIGTSSSGKTHLKDKVDNLFTQWDVMDASAGSDKALIYDDEWDSADVISMGELQQPSEEMLEFMKRAHGGDEEVVIRTTMGNPSTGFDTETIRKDAKSYHFTYAQFDADFEFWNRLLTIPVHESESKNRAVGKLQAGHSRIQLEDNGVEYGYDFTEGTERLRNHLGFVKHDAPKRVVLPTGVDHEWDCWEILEPIFDHSRSESNRIYGMVFNIVKASALLNAHRRKRVTTTVGDDNREEEALLAEPQDVANIARCLQALRATTHEIDRKKRAIVNAIRVKSGHDDTIEGLEPIREFLDESDTSVVRQGELENILEDLAENFLIDIQEDAGEGHRNVYRAYNWDKLGVPRIEENRELFVDCTDPMTGNPFLDEWGDVRSKLETTAQDMLKSADIERGGSAGGLSGGLGDGGDSTPTTQRSNTGGGLGAYGAGTNKDPEEELDEWMLDVLDRIEPVINGKRIKKMDDVPVESFLGMTSLSDPDRSEVDTDGTMLSPDHDVWSQPNHANDWVDSEKDARINIQDAIDEFIEFGLVKFDEVHSTDEEGAPVDATLRVER
jgi:hypothetical protein